ncbi:MAG: ATP-binding cassette, subfamily type secretion system permease/ATPase [Alphaproteobacteria bacterium]|jgi:ATP-binding cassette subfamily C protein|nr:ATP-binding cassette, subfamily type secretion system permease/ATPase [Alphaproteobacteria bacterium]
MSTAQWLFTAVKTQLAAKAPLQAPDFRALLAHARAQFAGHVHQLRAPDTIDQNQDGVKQWNAVARRTLASVGLFSLFVNILMLTLPLYLFQLSDRVLTSRSMDTLLMLSVVALGFIAVLSLLDILRRQILNRLATRFVTTLGGPVLASIVTNAKVSDSANLQALRNLHQVKSFISSPIMLLLFDLPLAPIYFAAAFLIHPDLGFIALGAGVLLIVIAIVNQHATSAPLGFAGMHAAKADAHAEALARNTQVINAMGMLNESILHWGRDQARALIFQDGALDRNSWISGVSKFARLVTQILILGVGAYLALHGSVTGGTMIAASIIAGRALQPFEVMIEGWRNLVQTRAAYAYVCATAENLKQEQTHLLLPRPEGKLTVDRLLYLPPGSKEAVLNGVSFELKPGEALAIVGPSGSGKSTLARMLVGCLYPTAGRVRLDGTELRNWDRRQFGEFTGYLPQEVELFPGTIKENVCRMRSDLPDEKIYQAAMFTDVHEMISHLSKGYETVLERSGAPLSGGQKQRIALARAFFGEPALVVLDEPNSNLDSTGEQALTETLQRAKEKRVTVVVITQRPTVLNCMDKLLILRAGRVEAFGPPSEVLMRIVKPARAAPASSTTNGTAQTATDSAPTPDRKQA